MRRLDTEAPPSYKMSSVAGKKPTIVDLFHWGSAALRVVEQRSPESAEALPEWLRGGLHFVDGTEVAVKAGAAAFDAGKPDPKDLPDAEVLRLLPDDEVKRFGLTGDPKQLVAAYKAAYLAKKTVAGFKSAASASSSEGGGTSS